MTHLTTNHPPTTRATVLESKATRSGPGAFLVRLWRRYQNRRAITRLLEMDAAGLRDLGLTHGDVAGALALPMTHDPSTHLADQLRERRRMRAPRQAVRAGMMEWRR